MPYCEGKQNPNEGDAVSYAFLAPILIFFVVFVLAPMIMGFCHKFLQLLYDLL